MPPEQRRQRILEILEHKKQAKVNDLAEQLRVSRETIRRDLTYMAERFMLRKRHGSAVSIQTGVENSLPKRMLERLDEKRLIAETASSCFTEGDSLFIDTGTTTSVLAEYMSRTSGLTVFTNSCDVAACLGNGPGQNAVYLLGGLYETETMQTQGPLVIDQIKRINTDYAVLAIGAIDEDCNFMHYNLEEASLAEAMAGQAFKTLVLADHTKFGKRALFKRLQKRDVNIIVTDREPDQNMLATLQALDIRVILPAH